jgi:hypothetical protein
MKKGIQLTENSFIALYVIFALAGGATAALTYFKYTYIARAIVGIATLYFYFDHHQYHEHYEPIEKLLLHPNKIKDFMIVFFGTLILVWAGMQVLETVLFYFKR